jgi:non-specific serine/threonine protein kinase
MGADSDLWFNRTEADIANVRAALGWLRDSGEMEAALDLAGTLAWFWTAPNYIVEGRSWYESLLGSASAGVEPAIRAKALVAAGDLADWHTDTDRAVALHEQGLELWREVGNRRQIASTLRGLGSAAIDHFDFDLAASLLGEARSLAIESGDQWTAAATANMLAVIFFERKDFAQAVRWHEQSLREWQDLGDTDHFPVTLNGLGMTYVAMGENQRAWDSFDAALTIAAERDDGHEIAKAVLGFGMIAASLSQDQMASQLLSASARQRQAMGIPLRPPSQKAIDATLERLRGQLGEMSFARAWSGGQALTVFDAIGLARSVYVPAPHSVDGLSTREREVLALLVEGASDHEIADRLFISRRTASKHVAAILEKLGATNRTAAATIAHRRGLV